MDPFEREEATLAPYAMRSRASRGRRHEEPATDLRTPFQRDRDRVIHSTAFRRLEYKTQVFVNHEGDHYRTRLTHTLEVAQISRSVARSLDLNEDLVEAIALSHDLGHPPFGHAGEEKLNELMSSPSASVPGFDHNRHCLRVVDHLEQRYPDFRGLNLSWEIREAIAKHYGRSDDPALSEFEPTGRPLLEAQLVDIGDSLAYDTHDVDDGLRSGYVTVDDFRGIELWELAESQVRSRWPRIDSRSLVPRIVSAIIDFQVRDLVEESRRRLERSGVQSPEAVRAQEEDLVAFSDEVAAMKLEMQSFLKERLYLHYRTLKMAGKGKRFVEAIFREFQRDPGQLPDDYRARIADEGTDRTICDYIAGMTDRYCIQEYERLFIPFADGELAR